MGVLLGVSRSLMEFWERDVGIALSQGVEAGNGEGSQQTEKARKKASRCEVHELLSHLQCHEATVNFLNKP